MVSGMPSIVNIDENNICNIIVENCATYDVTLERDDILGIMETETDELVPLTDDFILSVCQDIHDRFPKVKRKRLSRDEIKSSLSGTSSSCSVSITPIMSSLSIVTS
jgi:superfamily II helicase